MEEYEFQTCREVLEWMISQLHKNQPGATNTIQDLEDALGQVTSPEDYADGE